MFGLPADRLRSLLESVGRVETVGASFQVFKLGDLDVSLPRRDSKSGRGHKGFEITGDPSMSIEDAARRRDFRVNAILWDPLTDQYDDPFDGRGDIGRRLLRVVDPATFTDDSLRALRAIQFAARFGFTLDDEARTLCRSMPLDDLPAERIWGEVEKLLLAPTAVGRPRARAGAGDRREALSRAQGARRLSAGARVASRGRRLGAHAAGRRSGAPAGSTTFHARSRSR